MASKTTRDRRGSIFKKTVVFANGPIIVYDVRRRFKRDGKPCELFRRCYSQEDAERVRDEFHAAATPNGNIRHGHTSQFGVSLTYRSYEKAKARCNDPNDIGYHNYGGRGIEFRFASFEEFLAEVGERPSRDLTIDRIDNNGHYEKGNVKWSTKVEQRRNQRPRGQNQAALSRALAL